MEEKNKKINFVKKIYFSICKIKEYGELSKEGVKKSSYYVMDLILILAIIYASVLTFKMKQNANDLQEYLEQNLPNLIYEDGKLTGETHERIVLNHNLVKANFGAQLVIDTNIDYKTLTNEYKNIGEPYILLTENKYITINSQGHIGEHDYDEIIKQNTEKDKTIIIKDYFLNILSNISYGYYFFGYFIGSLIGTSIIVFLYNLLISSVVFIVCKIKKVKAKFSEIYSIGLYAHTLSILGYFIINFLPTSVIIYIQVLTFFIPIVYCVYAIYVNKWLIPENLS